MIRQDGICTFTICNERNQNCFKSERATLNFTNAGPGGDLNINILYDKFMNN